MRRKGTHFYCNTTTNKLFKTKSLTAFKTLRTSMLSKILFFGSNLVNLRHETKSITITETPMDRVCPNGNRHTRNGSLLSGRTLRRRQQLASRPTLIINNRWSVGIRSQHQGNRQILRKKQAVNFAMLTNCINFAHIEQYTGVVLIR